MTIRVNNTFKDKIDCEIGLHVDYNDSEPTLKYGPKEKNIVIREIEKTLIPLSSILNQIYTYKIDIIITNQLSEILTDYQICLDIDFASLISNGKVKSDCTDILLTCDNITLPMYIEEDTLGTSNTLLWTKLSFIENEEKTITLYYGYYNEDVTNVFDGESIFEFFDDFSGDLSKWTENNGTWSIVDGELYQAITGTSTYNGLYTSLTNSTNFIIETKGKCLAGGSITNYSGLLISPRFTDYQNFIGFALRPVNSYTYGWVYYISGTGDWASTSDVDIADYDEYHKVKIIKNGNYLTAIDINTLSETTVEFTSLTDGNIALMNASGYVYYKYIFVRQYIETEPTISYGNEVVL